MNTVAGWSSTTVVIKKEVINTDKRPITTNHINNSPCAFVHLGDVTIQIWDMESLDTLIYELQKLAVDMRSNKVGLCYQEVK